MRQSYDAVVVGSGPNGLAAAITLARAGRTVLVVEAGQTIGGGTRTAELTLPGFRHDISSAVHPLGAASPFFRTLPLAEHGLEWLHPPAPMAHPFDDGTAAVLERSVEATAETLGEDATAYRRMMAPLVANWDRLAADLLGPLRVPRHPLAFARFGLRAVRSARGLAEGVFRGERARALLAGLGCHSILPPEQAGSAAAGLVLCIVGHVGGWPAARGGSQSIAEAMEGYLRSLGGEMVTGTLVDSLEDLPPAGAVLLDVTPRQLLRMVDGLPQGYRRRLQRYRYGPGVFKVDWALDGPIPWKAAACARAGTLHLGGGLEEISEAERSVWRGEVPARPFVLLAQPSIFDQSRAPAGKHTAWAYCHVPNGSTFDMTDRIEAQVERFAPGFRGRVIARSVMSPPDLERHNPNCVGGDIAGGVHDLRHIIGSSALWSSPYATPAKGVFVCSSSTPPGPGVHGMCGRHAAAAALRYLGR